MDKRHIVIYAIAAGMLIAIPGCGKNGDAASEVRQTKFPGQVTAGGGSSGEVLGRVGPTKEGAYAGGTPGIAGGSGGNTGGAATGGSVQESGRGPSAGVAIPPASPQTGGTPGIAGGSGGNTGGAATGGSVPESGSLPAQSTTAPPTTQPPGTRQ